MNASSLCSAGVTVTTRSPRTIVLSLLAAGILIAGCNDGPAPIDCAQAGNAFHFMQTAASAEIEEVGGKLQLTLHDVGRTTWHSDRPSRDAGLLDTGAFLELWEELGIDAGAPAAITTIDGVTLTSSAVALFDPEWDEEERTLRYRIDEMADGFGIGELGEGVLDNVVVFVDPTALADNCAPDRKPSLLFVQSGLSGSIDETDDGLELRLEGVVATEFYASDPDREAGIVDTRSFLEDWASSPATEDEAPRAVLNVPGREDGPRQIVIELRRPRLEGTTVSFLVNVDPASDVLDDEDLPSTFDEAALFIEMFRTATNARISRGVARALPSGTTAPSISVGHIYQVISQAVSAATNNATSGDENSNVTDQNSTDAGIDQLLGLDTASQGIGASGIFDDED